MTVTVKKQERTICMKDLHKLAAACLLTLTIGLVFTSLVSRLEESTSKATKPDIDLQIAEKHTSRLVFTQHTATKLCFAISKESSHRNPTNVPCTPEVLAEIAKNHTTEK